MRASRVALVVCTLSFFAIGRASAVVVFSDNFDSYANQAAFQAVWPADTTTGTLATSPNNSAPNSVNYGLTAQRNKHSVGEIGNPSPTLGIRYSFDFYDSNGTAPTYRQYSEIIDGAGSSSGQLIAMGLNNNIGSNKYMARILGGDGGQGLNAFFKLDGPGSPNRSTGWHRLAVEVSTNLVTPSTLDYRFFVDGFLSRTLTGLVVTLRSFDAVRMGSNLSAGQSANFDNLLLETFIPVAIPEASSFYAAGLCGLMALGAGVYRRRRPVPALVKA